MEVPRFEVREGRNGEGKGMMPVSLGPVFTALPGGCPLCITGLAVGTEDARLLLLAFRVRVLAAVVKLVVTTSSEEGGIVPSALSELRCHCLMLSH